MTIAATIAPCRREEYIAASGIKIHFMTLRNHSRRPLRLTSEGLRWVSDLDGSVPKFGRVVYERYAPRRSLQREPQNVPYIKANREWVRLAGVSLEI